MSVDDLVVTSFVKTPVAIDKVVLSFCASINPSARPIYVQVKVSEQAKPEEAYSNVKHAVDQGQGKAVSGWLIWSWANLFIEARHHAVLKTEQGLIDLTPQRGGEVEVLFLPDPSREFDWDSKRFIPDIRQALIKSPLLTSYFQAVDRLNSLKGEVYGEKRSVPAADVDALGAQVFRAKRALLAHLAKEQGRNDRCFCGSGKKAKHCHFT